MLMVVLFVAMPWASESVFASDLVHTTARLSMARYMLDATTVGNKAMFAGGLGYRVVDIYDASLGDPTDSNAWSTATLSQTAGDLAATTVGNKAMFAGGYLYLLGGYIDGVDIYDADTDSWSTAALSQPRDALAATTVGNKAMFAGGYLGWFKNSDVVDIYDADTDTWSTATLSQARRYLSATAVGNKAMFAGGIGAAGPSSVVDIYDNDTGTWSTATLSQACELLAATTVGDKAMFAAGSSIDIYDAETDTWSLVTLPHARIELSATTVGNIAIFAGGRYSEGWTDVVDIYDADANTWSTTTLLVARGHMAATSVGNKAMFAGGTSMWGEGGQLHDVVDIYTIPGPATIKVAVDIKPGSCPNPLNVKSSGVLPVAVLGSADVNVLDIDPTSIAFSIGDVNVGAIRCGYEDVAAPVSDSNDCNCITDGPDGFLDLTLKFKTQRIVEAIGDVNDGDVLVLTLTGVLFDPMPFETPIEGADCILIRGRHKPINPADINKDGVVNMTDFALMTENWLQSSIVQD